MYYGCASSTNNKCCKKKERKITFEYPFTILREPTYSFLSFFFFSFSFFCFCFSFVIISIRHSLCTRADTRLILSISLLHTQNGVFFVVVVATAASYFIIECFNAHSMLTIHSFTWKYIYKMYYIWSLRTSFAEHLNLGLIALQICIKWSQWICAGKLAIIVLVSVAWIQLDVSKMIDMLDSAQSNAMEISFTKRSNEHSRKNYLHLI